MHGSGGSSARSRSRWPWWNGSSPWATWTWSCTTAVTTSFPTWASAVSCKSPHRLYIPLDIGHPELGQQFEARFQAFFAHELHRCARRAMAGYADTLSQALVTEGLACCFEAELPGGSVPMYATRVSGAALEAAWQRARPQLELPVKGWGEWFFGEREPELPMHVGYSMGYEVVARWLERTGHTAARAYAVPAAQVFAEAR